MERKKRKFDGVAHEGSSKKKRRTSERKRSSKSYADGRLQVRSIDRKTSDDALIRISFRGPKETHVRKHKSCEIEVCGEKWWVWIYINKPEDPKKKKRPKRGYVGCYLELIEGKYRSPEFWARVKFQVRVKHRNRRDNDDIEKNSTMTIANYDVSRGFRRLIRWDDLPDFIFDNGKLYIDVFMDVKTSLRCNDLKTHSPETCSSMALKLTKYWTNEELAEIEVLRDIACEKFGAKPVRRDFGSDSKKYGDTSGHSVIYVQDAFTKIPSPITDKIYKTARENLKHWTHRPESYITKIKRIEYIKYTAPTQPNKEGDWVGWHTDTDVTLVMSIMLSNSDEYTGGIYQAKLPDVKDFPLDRGDSIIFPGHILEHRVLPVKTGTRKILIIEFWKSDHTQSIKRSYEAWDSSSSSSS